MRYVKFISLPGDHARTCDDAIAGIDNDAIADSQACGNRCKPTGSPEQGDRSELGTAIHHDKDRPILAFAEKRAGRHNVASSCTNTVMRVST